MKIPGWAERGRSGWKYTGKVRPDFADRPGPGQESVWDYPRPPRLVRDRRRVLVQAGDVTIADSTHAVRVLETAGAPTVYIPPSDVKQQLLIEAPGGSMCEWKGRATYWSVRAGGRVLEQVGWSYEQPFAEFQSIAGYLCFYPDRLACYIAEERVRPQPGGFYGGWVTDEIVGPIKGVPGSEAW